MKCIRPNEVLNQKGMQISHALLSHFLVLVDLVSGLVGSQALGQAGKQTSRQTDRQAKRSGSVSLFEATNQPA